jgi:hypothetical protein
MKTTLAAGALLLALGSRALAHQLDEYVQATTLSVEKDRVQARIRLTPGVAVWPVVVAAIDTDGDGALSEAEQRAYAERVLRDLSLTVDGTRLPLRLVSWRSGRVEDLREGLGAIELELHADVPRGGCDRRLVFENRHETRIAAYLVNCLVPTDPGIRITEQRRNYTQSVYRLDYVDAAGRSLDR